MRRLRRLILMSLAFAAAVPTQAVRAAEPLPAVGARVRVLAPTLGPGWHTGMFNRLRVEPPCYRIIIFAPGPTRRVERTLSVRELERLQVSTVYDGQTRFEPAEPDEQAYVNEGWRDVSLEALWVAERRCRVRGSASGAGYALVETR